MGVYETRNNLKRAFKDFVFPRLSEVEVVVLAWILVMVIVDHWNEVLEHLVFNFSEPRLVILFFILVVGIVYALVYFPFNQKRMSIKQKRRFSLGFYLLLSGFSLWSVVGIINNGLFSVHGNLFNSLNVLWILKVLLQSVLTFMAALIVGRMNKEQILVSQVEDDQILWFEFLFMIPITLGLYLYLAQYYDLATTVVLNYFYVTTGLTLVRKLSGIIFN